MTSKEFVLWLKGFAEGLQEHNITPMQWDIVKGKLSEVNDGPSYNTHPPYVDGKGHPNPYYFSTSKPGFVVTTNPGYGSISYNPSTSTTNGYPSGSAWHYTSTSTQEKSEESTPQRQLLTDNHD